MQLDAKSKKMIDGQIKDFLKKNEMAISNARAIVDINKKLKQLDDDLRVGDNTMMDFITRERVRIDKLEARLLKLEKKIK